MSTFFNDIDKAIGGAIDFFSDPSKILSTTENLLTPKSLTLDDFFKKVDPILDVVDPGHNAIQHATTGQTTTSGQSPYFQTYAPMILNAFFPGLGSAAQGVSNLSEGKTGQAVIALGSAALQAGGSFGGAKSDTITLSDGSTFQSAMDTTGSAVSKTSFLDAGTMKIAGTVLTVGAKAYSIYNAEGALKATVGTVNPSMVSDTQQAPAVTNYGDNSAYGILAGNSGDIGAAQSIALADAATKATNNKYALIALAAAAGFYIWRK